MKIEFDVDDYTFNITRMSAEDYGILMAALSLTSIQALSPKTREESEKLYRRIRKIAEGNN